MNPFFHIHFFSALDFFEIIKQLIKYLTFPENFQILSKQTPKECFHSSQQIFVTGRSILIQSEFSNLLLDSSFKIVNFHRYLFSSHHDYISTTVENCLSWSSRWESLLSMFPMKVCYCFYSRFTKLQCHSDRAQSIVLLEVPCGLQKLQRHGWSAVLMSSWMF